MLVNLTHTLTLAATQQDAWNLLRDTKRLAALIPGVESVTPVDVEKHVARIVERVGPFRLSLKLEVTIVQAHTLLDGTASIRVLEKLGMKLVGTAHDPDEGEVLQWRMEREDYVL